VLSNPFQVLQAGIPAIEEHGVGLESPAFGGLEHGEEVIVLGQIVLGLVVDPRVQGKRAIAIGPHQADQIDATDDRLVLARPVAMDRLDRLGVELVEGRVVEDQDAIGLVDQRLDLSVEDLGVGLDSVKHASIGVMCGWVASGRLTASGLATTRGLGGSDEEVDIIDVAALGMAHGSIVNGPSIGRKLYSLPPAA
jgi:hypothetical protein